MTSIKINLTKQYGEHCDILYTDTDSLLLEVRTEDFCKHMEQIVTEYDSSNYPKDHYVHSMDNERCVCWTFYKRIYWFTS